MHPYASSTETAHKRIRKYHTHLFALWTAPPELNAQKRHTQIANSQTAFLRTFWSDYILLDGSVRCYVLIYKHLS